MPGDRGRGGDWWSSDDRSADADLPSWAARNLDDASQDSALTPSAPVTAASSRRHATPPRTPSRLRGWGLAVVSLAAAAAAVPLAVSTLAHQDDALPRVGTFPVVSPGQLDHGRPLSGEGSGPVANRPAEPGPTDAIVSIPAETPSAAPPTVRPLAQARTAAPARRNAPAVAPVTPVTPPTPATPATSVVVPPSTTTTTTTTSRPAPRSGQPTTVRSGPSSTSSGSDSNGGSGNGGGGNGGGNGGGGNGGIVGGLVGTVGNTVNGLTG